MDPFYRLPDIELPSFMYYFCHRRAVWVPASKSSLVSRMLIFRSTDDYVHSTLDYSSSKFSYSSLAIRSHMTLDCNLVYLLVMLFDHSSPSSSSSLTKPLVGGLDPRHKWYWKTRLVMMSWHTLHRRKRPANTSFGSPGENISSSCLSRSIVVIFFGGSDVWMSGAL
jgi:hypothetical protein